MRAGGCTVQQALTVEAAAVVKQAVSLARRRGNAQVTPLHVASAMLQAAAPPGLLRAACLRSHSHPHPHPLQCKALELCFNVALNRLPASAVASPLLGNVYYPPSLSNALVAAFKRAQAHQRRGSVETQQQPVLAVKIELEQLVISILDDPSVSRVMREAGFSSTQVKANVEQAVSSIEGNNTCTTTAATELTRNPNPSAAASSSPPSQETKPGKLALDQVREEDVAAILDCLATRIKRRVMVVSESAAAAEAATRAAVDKIKRGDTRQEALRGAQVVSLCVSMFRDTPRDEAERRLAELRCVVKASGRAGGAVLVVEDLRWAAEFWAARVEAGRKAASSCYYYCAVEHAVAEVRALACRGDGVWLVGYGTYHTNMRCRAGNPSLESLWGIQTLAVPASSLALSLNCIDIDSSAAARSHHHHQSMKAKCDRGGNGSTSPVCLSLLNAACGSGRQPVTTCCAGDCSVAKSDAMKALHYRSIVPSSTTPSIPTWLQHCRDQEPPRCKKWSSACGDSPPPPHCRTTLNFSTVMAPSSSVSSYEQYYHLHQPYQPWLVADVHEPKHPWKVQYGGDVDEAAEGVMLLNAKVKSRDSSASNGSVEVEYRSRFKELSAENLKVLCGALENEVPWQKEIVPEMASTVLRCRSGMVKRRNDVDGAREETWMSFLGGDRDGKVRVARELARLVFGSRKSFVSIDGDASSPGRSDSTEQHRAKRTRSSEASRGYMESLFEAVHDNPHRVILMEDVEQTDARCQMGIKEAIKSGVVRSQGGVVASLADAIIILSCESFDSSSRACSPSTIKKKTKAKSEEDETNASSTSCFDLNMSMDDDDDDDDDEIMEDCCFGDSGLLKAVNRTLFFRRPEAM